MNDFDMVLNSQRDKLRIALPVLIQGLSEQIEINKVFMMKIDSLILERGINDPMYDKWKIWQAYIPKTNKMITAFKMLLQEDFEDIEDVETPYEFTEFITAHCTHVATINSIVGSLRAIGESLVKEA